MSDSKKKKQDAELEKEMREAFKRTRQYLLLTKVKIQSSAHERPKEEAAIEACFQDYVKKELEIKKLKEREKK